MKLKVLWVVRRIISWQILHMDKCMCVVYLFYTRVHAWFDAMRVFCFCTSGTHACDTYVPFKLWMICTVPKDISLYVTGFWKTDQIVTLGLFQFISPANGYTCTLHMHSTITRLGLLVCFSTVSFTDPVNS